MTQTFPIVSRIVPMPPVQVQGAGLTPLEARRAALNIAAKVKGVPQPIVAEGREGAAIIRRWAATIARQAVWSTPLNGTSSMCFDQRYGN
jgi:hypothetical protein